MVPEHIMNIEQAIQQKQFKHEYERLAVNLVYTQHYFDAGFAEVLKPFKLTRPQFNILRILRGQHPKSASVNLLIERMIDRSSNASRIVDRLEAKKLVTRQVCPSDRRKMDVKITGAGLDLLAKMDSVMESHFKQYGSLTQKEARTLNNLLDKLRND